MSKQASRRKQLICHWNSLAKRSALSLALLASTSPWTSPLQAQDDAGLLAHVQTAQFKIPFNVDARGGEGLQVQLWVSADEGTTWQAYGSVPVDRKSFEFRAAAEGVYLFKVATLDASGTSFPNPGPPLKVLVDTTKPQSEIRADINEQGQLVVDVRVRDENLDTNTAVLRIRSDHESQWRDLVVELQPMADHIYSAQVVTDLAPCREVAIVFSIKDRSLNEGEASCQYSLPRTAAGPRDMTLASTKAGDGSEGSARKLTQPQLTSTPGATRWNPTVPNSTSSSKAAQPNSLATGQAPLGGAAVPTLSSSSPSQATSSPGRLASESQLSLELPTSSVTEELPLPVALVPTNLQSAELQSADLGGLPTAQRQVGQSGTSPTASSQPSGLDSNLQNQGTASAATRDNRSNARELLDSQPDSSLQASTIGRAYHCKSRAFSLDYSVEALGGSALADVELWGTEDGGRAWQKWGSDPDRTSPFDVQVGNDGLFGFRMVIVGANGVVSNRPREGDSADVWINIDTLLPAVKITRAVYGEGPEDGLLVIDYNCDDSHLVERPITISYSDRVDGPWTLIATGLANSGIYLWKADPSLPDKIYLKLECVDKAGNIGTHRLDLPIDVRGLAPRGIIQGFRAIEMPAQ